MNKAATLAFVMVTITFSQGSDHLGRSASLENLKMAGIASNQGEVKLCSGQVLNFGKCTGSRYCRACKTCEYCAYCNNGGSCGVCSVSVVSTKPKYKPKSSYSHSYKKKRNSSQSNSRSNNAIRNKKTELPAIKSDIYVITKATSLRILPDSKSEVLKRMAVGDRANVIDCSNEFWCKVFHNGRKGWVKKNLLEKQ